MMMAYGFREMNFHQIGRTVFDYNEAMIKLYEKLGFSGEATSRKRFRRDVARHALLRTVRG